MLILDVDFIFGAMLALIVQALKAEVCCVSFPPQVSSRIGFSTQGSELGPTSSMFCGIDRSLHAHQHHF